MENQPNNSVMSTHLDQSVFSLNYAPKAHDPAPCWLDWATALDFGSAMRSTARRSPYECQHLHVPNGRRQRSPLAVSDCVAVAHAVPFSGCAHFADCAFVAPATTVWSTLAMLAVSTIHCPSADDWRCVCVVHVVAAYQPVPNYPTALVALLCYTRSSSRWRHDAAKTAVPTANSDTCCTKNNDLSHANVGRHATFVPDRHQSAHRSSHSIRRTLRRNSASNTVYHRA